MINDEIYASLIYIYHRLSEKLASPYDQPVFDEKLVGQSCPLHSFFFFSHVYAKETRSNLHLIRRYSDKSRKTCLENDTNILIPGKLNAQITRNCKVLMKDYRIISEPLYKDH